MRNWLLLLFFSAFLFSCGVKTKIKQELTTKASVGEAAPNFSFTDQNGVSRKLSDLKGKVVFINFFDTYCGICMTEMPRIQKDIFEHYENNPNFVVLTVAQNKQEDIDKYRERRKLTFPIVQDEQGSIYNLYAVDMIPRNFLVNKEGELIYSSVGFQEKEFEKLKAKIADQLR